MSETLEELLHISNSVPEFNQRGRDFLDLKKLPVIDATSENDIEPSRAPISLPGLNAFHESVKRDIELIEKHIKNRSTRNVKPLSSNAPYIIAVWRELVNARPPILSIGKMFSETQKNISGTHDSKSTKSTPVKIDIVAENGAKWIRVNTSVFPLKQINAILTQDKHHRVKNSRILSELREFDSYLTSSDDEDDKHSSPVTENSLIRLGKQLIATAKSNPLSTLDTTAEPKITLCLTRLVPLRSSLDYLLSAGARLADGDRTKTHILSSKEDTDPRITESILELLDMGINVVLGERQSTSKNDSFESEIQQDLVDKAETTSTLIPSTNINLDLSVLIALVSDLTHAPLPSSSSEAINRFIPNAAERARSQKRRERQKALLATARGTKQTSKAVTPNATENRSVSFDEVEEIIHSRALERQVTEEMKLGLLDEISSRMDFNNSSNNLGEVNKTESQFWTTADVRDRCIRIVGKIGGPDERRRVQALFATSDFDTARAAYWENSRYPLNFIPIIPIKFYDNNVLRTPRLTDKFWFHLQRTCSHLLSQPPASHPRSFLSRALIEEDRDEIERADVISSNSRLTVHTVQSMLQGASRGFTTLTANRSSVREIVKEMGRFAHMVSPVANVEDGKETASFWIVDPRSLAEVMRSDYCS